MKKEAYILLAVIAVLVIYIVTKKDPEPIPHIIDNSKIELLKAENIVLQDSIASIKLRLDSTEVKERIIHEVYTDSINNIKYLSDDEQIELFSKLISEEGSD